MIRIAAAIMLIVGGIGGTGMASQPNSLYQPIGYYLPDGRYVRTYHCWSRFVGYDYYGRPIYQRVCGYR